MKDFTEKRTTEEIMQQIYDSADDILRRLILEIHTHLIVMNPVDTGTSRGSWIITQRRPSKKRLKYPVPRIPNLYSYAVAKARQKRIPTLKFKSSPTYIVNNVDYIVRLNRRGSNKANAGWVQASVALGVANLENWIRAVFKI